MSNFISWIEKDEQIYYLTAHDIYRTKRGKELRDYCGAEADVIGHGAIRYYYDSFVGGKDVECDDFSTPDNFPVEIVAEIKKGAFRGMGHSLILLNKLAQDKFDKACKLAQADFNKACKLARDKYCKVCKPAQDKFNKVYKLAQADFNKACKLAWDEFNKVYKLARDKYCKACKPARDEFNKVYKLAWDEYCKAFDRKFWDLFMVPKNRNPLWV